MIWHPLTLGIWLLLVLSWLIYLPMAWRIITVLPQWRPSASDVRQLRSERRMELLAHQGRWVLALQVTAGVLMVIGMGLVWPAYVPGAMCGTGVLQAMGTAGEQVFFFQTLAVGVLYVWQSVQRLDATHPHGVLTVWHARILLLAVPMMAMGGAAWVRAVDSVDGSPPVNCCAVVYAQAGSDTIEMLASPAHGAYWIMGCLAGALAIAIWGGCRWRCDHRIPGVLGAVILSATLVWVGVAVVTLKVGVAPYVYQVLSHPCPWCLFLPVHGGMGFLYFGLLAWITAKSLAMEVAQVTARRVTELGTAARESRRQAGCHLMIGSLFFVIAVLWPVLSWRLKHGTWLT